MSTAPLTPIVRGDELTQNAPAPRLVRYHSLHAAVIATWPATPVELLWLAPGTPPPLTPEKVDAWGREGEQRFVLADSAGGGVIGYSELNLLRPHRDQMWIGHFILAPSVRGRGWATRFVRTLLHLAFGSRRAAHVILLVFPENHRAIRCYERAGFLAAGHETKYFDHADREYFFMRMTLSADRHRRLAPALDPRFPILPFA